jgi:MFS family permease
MGTDVTLSAYRTELFPTSMRSSASGATNLVSVTGGIVGLMSVSALYGVVGSTWTAILIVASLSLVVPATIWFLFPETARRTLEDIAPNDSWNRRSTNDAQRISHMSRSSARRRQRQGRIA